MKKIKLTQGKYALVDDEDYEWLSQWKWYAARYCRTFYALRNMSKIEAATNGKRGIVYMHRALLGFPSSPIDHRDGNGLNNRRSNIELSTPLLNAANKNHVGVNNTSGAIGVSWSKRDNRWRARVKRGDKEIHLGNHKTLEEAIAARDKFIENEKHAPSPRQ